MTREGLSGLVITLLLAAAATLVAGAQGAGKPSISLSRPLPSAVWPGERLIVQGRVEHASSQTRAGLQENPGQSWKLVAQAELTSTGAFTLHWRVNAQPGSEIRLRVVALADGKPAASTGAQQAFVRDAPRFCAPPPPPHGRLPSGYGWVVGGLYLEGGAYTENSRCQSRPYTVTVTDHTRHVVATQSVAGHHSYRLELPAGRYTLSSDGCDGSATAKAGQQVTANTYCLYP